MSDAFEATTLDSLLPITLWLLSYLVGSVSSAILICRLLGLPDPRQEGSQNPGATNVLRVGGKVAGALTLLGDLGKGVLPVYLSLTLHPSATVAALCGVFAFIGHCYPVYFDLRGGKGVATAFGVLAMLHWPSAVFTGALWVAVFALTRVSSLASLISWTLSPFLIYFFADAFLNPLLIMITILIYRHYPNLFLLAKGEENRFSEPSANDEEPSIVSAVNEEPSAVDGEPSAVLKEPSAVLEKPSAVLKEPSAVLEKPSAERSHPPTSNGPQSQG